MSRDRRGDGVQVVGGSNPPCPTKSNHSRSISYRIILTHADVVAQMQAPRTDNGGAPPMLTAGGRYDLEFGKFATEWRITKRHMRTRYTIGDPAQKAIVGRIS
jgi:hypothetical protein